ncbi:hypothetical protein G6N05_07260 [Flavobacterium sp. F372]|jgi:hypothetical protein|uniref:PsbP C-terminal domain-containing protein n=1 Tax=Flavobacterium bernardetii TaxID=2813823 RepID=A0ABR7IXH6_9FLAO|nr:hypothetical protein [Flavobacterium bernardetii]MBC5834457.1 hypothetical protein [Flavobacterium bernardetii]NHF69904.1 hypothetical protein [Flavobacterium bernardetii]
MKKTIAIFTTILVLMTMTSFAQTELKKYKAGHTFEIGLPEYMSKTIGINGSSAIEYQNIVKEVYGFIIFDTKEDLDLVDMKFSSINEFYDDFIKDFLKDEEKRKVSKPQFQKKGEINFIESDVTFYDKEAKTEIYYLVGIVETKTSYYKVMSWAAAEDKDKFKADFQKILYSLKD